MFGCVCKPARFFPPKERTFTTFYVIKFYKLPLKVNLGPAPHSTLHKLHRIDYVSPRPRRHATPPPPQCIFPDFIRPVYIRILYYSLTFIAKWGTHLHDSHARLVSFITCKLLAYIVSVFVGGRG